MSKLWSKPALIHCLAKDMQHTQTAVLQISLFVWLVCLFVLGIFFFFFWFCFGGRSAFCCCCCCWWWWWWWFVRLFVGCLKCLSVTDLPGQFLRAATLRQRQQIKFSISPNHTILTPGQPVPELTLYRQAPDRVATGKPIFLVTGMARPGKIPAQAGIEPRVYRSGGGHLTTRPARRLVSR